jgi:hypothetical protein
MVRSIRYHNIWPLAFLFARINSRQQFWVKILGHKVKPYILAVILFSHHFSHLFHNPQVSVVELEEMTADVSETQQTNIVIRFRFELILELFFIRVKKHTGLEGHNRTDLPHRFGLPHLKTLDQFITNYYDFVIQGKVYSCLTFLWDFVTPT